MGLLELPAEIRLRILEDDDLDTDDCKALRLTTWAFYPFATTAVFRRIPISKTKKDWDAFSNIASTPHLADRVREVVWYELIEDARTLCHSQGMQEGCWCEVKASEEFPVTSHELAPLAKDLFWLTPETCDARDGVELKEMRKKFLSLVDRLPKLESFVSTPMPPRYILSDGPYTFTAQLFYRYLGLTGPGYSRHSISSGFFHFLAPAMIREASSIRRLHFVDHPFRSAIYNFADPQSPVFENLTDLNLYLSVARHTEDLASCLRRAKNLERLRICMEVLGSLPSSEALAALLGTSPTRHWPRLTTLELGRLSTGPFKAAYADAGVPHLATEARSAFMALLLAHSQTLRSLTLHECEVYRDIVEEMAGLPGLHLESFRVIASEQGDTEWVSEQELLDFVNGVDESGGCIAHVPAGTDINTFSAAGNVMPKDQGALACEVWDNAVLPTANDYDLFEERSHGSNGQSVYAREKRERGAPRWKSSRSEDEDRIFYWKSDDPDAYETRTWRFTHRSGAFALGDEPLEFFSDWDSESEGVDIVRPVPVRGELDGEWELPDDRSEIPEEERRREAEEGESDDEYADFGDALVSDGLFEEAG